MHESAQAGAVATMKRSRRFLLVALPLLLVLFFGAGLWLLDRADRGERRVAATNPIRQFNLSRADRMVSITIDTRQFRLFEQDYSLMLIVRPQDDSVDQLHDPGIKKSDLFDITGDTRTVRVDLDDAFVARADAIEEKLGSANLQCYIALLPKSVRPEQVTTLMDVTALGGRRIHITSDTN
jgi:hypothetical protein